MYESQETHLQTFLDFVFSSWKDCHCVLESPHVMQHIEHLHRGRGFDEQRFGHGYKKKLTPWCKARAATDNLILIRISKYGYAVPKECISKFGWVGRFQLPVSHQLLIHDNGTENRQMSGLQSTSVSTKCV